MLKACMGGGAVALLTWMGQEEGASEEGEG